MGDVGKLIVAKGFKKLLKVQKISQSGHTDCENEHILGYKFIIEERSVKATAKNIFSKPQIWSHCFLLLLKDCILEICTMLLAVVSVHEHWRFGY